MIIEDKITVKNYKCFDSTGGGFDRIMPINVIIGKNNSGKSSLIDLIKYLIQNDNKITEVGRDNIKAEVIIEHSLLEDEIIAVFPSNTSEGGIPGRSHLEYGKKFIGEKYCYSVGEKKQKAFKKFDVSYVQQASKYINGLANRIQIPFVNMFFCYITAERDIVSEGSNSQIQFSPNGVGATNAIQQIINRTDRDSRLIEIELLRELNAIINPDIEFSRILVQQDVNNNWEIFFENSESNRIALSKMGSGIKTVLLVLLNLIVRPVIENKNRNSYVFGFEELENNLHPSLQRRLYNYIKEYSEKYQAYFFLTTHSNVVIDSFGIYKNSQIIHVVNDGLKSISTTLLSYTNTKDILSDLGLKASDILQSNGVIWVEGPSDRNYINKWLEILAPELKEGLHYSVMFYGGRLLSNLTFDFEWFNKDVIPLLKINRNAFVILDRDGKTMNAKINETKSRISHEIGANNYWITKGREIENYLSDSVVRKWLLNDHSYKTEFTNEKNEKLENNILNCRAKIKYNLSKTVYSAEIVKYFDSDNLNILDLEQKLKVLILKIKEWNK